MILGSWNIFLLVIPPDSIRWMMEHDYRESISRRSMVDCGKSRRNKGLPRVCFLISAHLYQVCNAADWGINMNWKRSGRYGGFVNISNLAFERLCILSKSSKSFDISTYFLANITPNLTYQQDKHETHDQCY